MLTSTRRLCAGLCFAALGLTGCATSTPYANKDNSLPSRATVGNRPNTGAAVAGASQTPSATSSATMTPTAWNNGNPSRPGSTPSMAGLPGATSMPTTSVPQPATMPQPATLPMGGPPLSANTSTTGNSLASLTGQPSAAGTSQVAMVSRSSQPIPRAALPDELAPSALQPPMPVAPNMDMPMTVPPTPTGATPEPILLPPPPPARARPQ